MAKTNIGREYTDDEYFLTDEMQDLFIPPLSCDPSLVFEESDRLENTRRQIEDTLTGPPQPIRRLIRKVLGTPG